VTEPLEPALQAAHGGRAAAPLEAGAAGQDHRAPAKPRERPPPDDPVGDEPAGTLERHDGGLRARPEEPVDGSGREAESVQPALDAANPRRPTCPVEAGAQRHRRRPTRARDPLAARLGGCLRASVPGSGQQRARGGVACERHRRHGKEQSGGYDQASCARRKKGAKHVFSRSSSAPGNEGAPGARPWL
jgi:hypothetical protein